jgi:hypothetical protein
MENPIFAGKKPWVSGVDFPQQTNPLSIGSIGGWFYAAFSCARISMNELPRDQLVVLRAKAALHQAGVVNH